MEVGHAAFRRRRNSCRAIGRISSERCLRGSAFLLPVIGMITDGINRTGLSRTRRQGGRRRCRAARCDVMPLGRSETKPARSSERMKVSSEATLMMSVRAKSARTRVLCSRCGAGSGSGRQVKRRYLDLGGPVGIVFNWDHSVKLT